MLGVNINLGCGWDEDRETFNVNRCYASCFKHDNGNTVCQHKDWI